MNGIAIESGRTAISRNGLSLPLKIMEQRSCFTKEDNIFDMGHGRGGDMVELRKMGYTVAGWDPNHYVQGYSVDSLDWKDISLQPDFIYCGYVLNVLESPELRIALAKDIFDMLDYSGAAGFAVRSFREVARSKTDNWVIHGDGWLTSSNTFQYGFTPANLVSVLDEAGFSEINIIKKSPVIAIAEK